MKHLLGILIKIVLPLSLGVYLIWYFFQSMSPTALDVFYNALGEANYGWIFLSLILSFFGLLSRAYRWRYTLEPLGHQTKFWNRYHALMIGYIVNLTIPRAGEASRAVMLYRSDGVPFSRSFGTILAERAVDLVMLFGIASLTAYLGYDDFWEIKQRIQTDLSPKNADDGSSWLGIVFWLLLLLGIGGMAAVFIIKSLRDKFVKFVRELLTGIFSIFRSRHPFLYIGHTFFIWGTYICYFSVAFWSLEETVHVPFEGIMIAFIAGSLGITFTNGGIGAFPLLVGLVVDFYLGSSGDQAEGVGKALGMIIWVSQTLMMILLGLLSVVLLPKNYTGADEQLTETVI